MINPIIKIKLLFFVSVFYCSSVLAHIPPGYYNAAAGLTGLPLKTALHGIIGGHNVVSYSSLYTHYQHTDKKPDGKVWDMYSDIPGGIAPYEFTFGQTCGSYSGEGDCYNREHSFPQSWFSGNTSIPIYSDLFNVYPTDGSVNNIRSNYPFGDVTTVLYTSQNGSKMGNCNYPDYIGTVFEPVDSFKGDFARTLFYIDVRYFTEDAGWAGSEAANGSQLKAWAVRILKLWCALDPVSIKEHNRNDSVYVIQNNRNPFIDHPEWLDSIYVTTTNIAESFFANSVSVSPNPSDGNFSLNISSGIYEPIDIYIYSLYGTLIYSSKIGCKGLSVKNDVDIRHLAKGVYILKLLTEKNILSKQIIIQ
jgi:endonuclease I